MTPELLAKYDGLRVPRYTSYPTSPHFHDGVQAAAYGAWLAALSPAQAVSLYLHVPYCKEMCWYCGCHTKVAARYEPVAAYAALLRQEIALVAATVPGRLRVGHLHWGGGTPNSLSAEDFSRIMADIQDRFDIAPGAELAMEADPRTLTPDMVAAMAASGITRVSLGVQDFNAEVQQRVNRVQSLALIRTAVERLRAAGINALNLDLMYGLPAQTEADCRESARLALSLDPDRLAVFGYAHVPWMRSHQRLINESELPDGPSRWRQFATLADTLTGAGMVAVGLDHFAKPTDSLAVAQRAGTLRRNFQGYTEDSAGVLLGFGASAIGALPGGYVQNNPAVDRYAAAINAGTLATAKGLVPEPEDILRREVIEQIMCDMAVDLAALAARYGRREDHFARERAALAPLIADGLAAVTGWRITIPESARPMMRTVAAVFDTRLAASQAAGTARHSRAI